VNWAQIPEAARRNRETRAGLDPPLISSHSALVPSPPRLIAVGWWSGVETRDGGAAPRGSIWGGNIHWATRDWGTAPPRSAVGHASSAKPPPC